MENLVQKDSDSYATIQKFEALKELYQLTSAPNDNMDTVLVKTAAWKKKYGPVIGDLRKQTFFGKLFVSKSSTQTMVEELEPSLPTNRPMLPALRPALPLPENQGIGQIGFS